MMMETHVLTIDDDKSILAAYESILSPRKKNTLEDALLQLEMLHEIEDSDLVSDDNLIDFNLLQATNGLDGINQFKNLFDQGISIPVCIVDMRMPNGIDGLETSLRLKQIDPYVHIIIATAYSDRSEKEILASLKSNIYYVRKPFNSEEIYQLVYSLSISYEATKTIHMLNSDLEKRVEEEIEKNRQKDSLLLHQAKLASMGEMIGNIAHQWRQPLNIISMMFQKMHRQYKNGNLNDEIADQMLHQAMDTIHHMSQTIDDFRGYFEPNKEKKEYSVLKTIQESISLVVDSFTLSNISIELINQEDAMLLGYSEDLKQVLMNLLNNSKDAITSNTITGGYVTFELSTDDDSVSLIFTDNGGGIPSEYLDKIFEPYFTTKHKSQGTGIGLYMSKRIIDERIGGSISVTNHSTGACFIIHIPIHKPTQGLS